MVYDDVCPMGVEISEKSGTVKIFGRGSPGGKGEGLVQIDGLDLPKTRKLATWVLTTTFYDRFIDCGRVLDEEALRIIASILEDVGDAPLGIRSSATNEAGPAGNRARPVHAGENASFMLPNNHPESAVRLAQAAQAVSHVYEDFRRKQPSGGREKMAIVISPIPGLFDDTLAGPVYYPYISGVANSFFPHALKNQNPEEGFARIAFGHGYATVLDDFPVISMATIRNPIPLNLLRIGQGQQFFYALDMTKNRDLRGEELETMRKLHVRFASYHKIRQLGLQNNQITIEELVQNNHYDFRTGLAAIMETIGARISSHFQIEFVFNLDFTKKDDREGTFHVVQLTPLPGLKFETLAPPRHVRRTYIAIANAQGHGVLKNIKSAVVVSPFVYTKEMRAPVRRGRIKDYADNYKGVTYTPLTPDLDHNPLWNFKADCAFPSATQNEINAQDAKNLVKNGVYVVAEGANMPTTAEGVEVFLDARILFAPGKAANAGGVSTSGLEMSQNSQRLSWPRDEVDKRLHGIMKSIHKTCVEAAEAYGTPGNYVNGANIGGFLKVARAMIEQGLV